MTLPGAELLRKVVTGESKPARNWRQSGRPPSPYPPDIIKALTFSLPWQDIVSIADLHRDAADQERAQFPEIIESMERGFNLQTCAGMTGVTNRLRHEISGNRKFGYTLARFAAIHALHMRDKPHDLTCPLHESRALSVSIAS